MRNRNIVLVTMGFVSSSALATLAMLAPVAHAAPTVKNPCPAVKTYANGTFGPILCTNGKPNPYVLNRLMEAAPSIMALPANATSSAITESVCSDVKLASNPLVVNAYSYQYAKYHWSGANITPGKLGSLLINEDMCGDG